MKVRITYKSPILGDGPFNRFSEGDGVFSDITKITNIPARMCAESALKKRKKVTWGMWTAEPILTNKE